MILNTKEKEKNFMFMKNGKKITENKFAEILACVGGAMKYIKLHGDLEGYEAYYMENKEKKGFHYKMQRYGDQIVRKELRCIGVYYKKSRAKRSYRYYENNSKRVDMELYDYFKFILDYVVNNEVLFDITRNIILKDCKCKAESEFKLCLNQILDWPYKRLVKLNTDLTLCDEKKQQKAGVLLQKMYEYTNAEVFMSECKTAHNIF